MKSEITSCAGNTMKPPAWLLLAVVPCHCVMLLCHSLPGVGIVSYQHARRLLMMYDAVQQPGGRRMNLAYSWKTWTMKTVYKTAVAAEKSSR